MEKHTDFQPDLIELSIFELGLDLGRLRQPQPQSQKDLAESMNRYGQLHPLVVAKDDKKDCYQLVDGFKRFHVLKKQGGKAICRARVIKGGPRQWKTAMLLMNWGARSVSQLEEGMVLVSLLGDGLSMSQIGALLNKHKSWVSRRVSLVRQLDEQVKQHLRLGLINGGVGRTLASLPRGNQPVVLEQVLEHKLTMREVEKLVKTLAKSKEPVRTCLGKAVQDLLDKRPGQGKKPDPSDEQRLDRALMRLQHHAEQIQALLQEGRVTVCPFSPDVITQARQSLAACETVVTTLHQLLEEKEYS